MNIAVVLDTEEQLWMEYKLKFFENGLTKSELNKFRFEVLQDLARGKITAQEAKQLCGVKNTINQNAVFVPKEGSSYVRLEGGTSSLSH